MFMAIGSPLVTNMCPLEELREIVYVHLSGSYILSTIVIR